MEKIDIKLIMEEIKKEIQEKKIEEVISFSEVSLSSLSIPVLDLQSLLGDLQSANENYFVDPARPVERNIKGKIKKLIRKVMFFYIKPIVEDQNLYNINVLDILKQVYAYIESEDLYKRRMERMIERLLNENKKISKQLDAMEKQER